MNTIPSGYWTCIALWFALAGCSRGQLGPRKEIAIPEGGPPVLTTKERAAQQTAPLTMRKLPATGAVAQASFEEPQILKPLERWTEQEAAADALGRIGAAAVPSLVEALENPDPAAREKAVEVLGRMGSDAAPAVPALVKLLDDPDEKVRKATARTLGQIGPPAKDAVPILMRTLLEQPPARQVTAAP